MRRLLVALLALAALAGCTSSGGASEPAAPQYQGRPLTPAEPRPSFTLTDTAGKPFSFAAVTRGHPTLLFFGYTLCPDICPTTMADIEFALKRVPAEVAKQTYVVFVSTDVKNDTPAVIKEWLGNFDKGAEATFVGLHGTQGEVDAAQAVSKVFLAEEGGQTHSTEVKLYGPDDYAHVSYVYDQGAGDEQAAMAHDIQLIAGN